ncbi:MAG: CHAT domain-containing tetratricopeptide repeat protein [Saprospiraceae bacterium]
MKTRPFPAFVPVFLVGHFWRLCAVVLLFLPVRAGAQVADTSAARLQVDSLVALNRSLIGQNNFDEALRVIEIAEQAASSAFGIQSELYAKSLLNHGRTFQIMGRKQEAEPYYLRSIAIWKALGDIEYTSAQNNLGILYIALQRYEHAIGILKESASARKKANHPDYSRALYNLGDAYRLAGRYEAAERCFSETANIRGIKPGKKSRDYANALNGLAVSLFLSGRYEEAEPVYQEALPILKSNFGDKATEYLGSLGNLAQLYAGMGRYALAEQAMLDIIAILGEEAPEYANNALNLAGVYLRTKRYAESEAFMIKARDSREKHLGRMHTDYAQSLDNLAALYAITHRYAEAEGLYQEALVIREAVIGKNHPDYAANLNNLGLLYFDTERFAEAEPLFLAAQTIWEKTLQPESPGTLRLLFNLAQLYMAWGKLDKAAPKFLAANAGHRNLVAANARTTSENEMFTYLGQYEGFFNTLYSFAEIHPTPEFTSTTYDNALLLKDFLLEKNRRLMQAVQEADTATQDTFEKWQACQRNLSKVYALGKRDPQLEQEAEGHEKTLARSLAAFTEVDRTPRWQQVRNVLQPAEAAIEFVKYAYFDRPSDTIMHTRYAALLLLPGTEAPQFILLCEERQIEALLPMGTAIEELSKSETRADLIEKLYSPFATGGKPSLHALLWAPIEKALAGHDTKTVYFAPTGILNRLNLGALWWNKSAQTLADRYRLVQLGSTREIIAPNRTAKRPKPVSALIYGGIQYDMDSTAIARANREMAATAQDTTGGLFRFSPHNNTPTDQPATNRGDHFRPLPASGQEARHLYDLLRQLGISSTLRTGYSATEESFKQIGTKDLSPNLLHIATHGFFFPDGNSAGERVSSERVSGERVSSERVSGGRVNGGRVSGEPVFEISEHPMIRSGLLFAGANYAWKNKRPMSGMEDGILTAHEVSQMNLSNTDLVVLSACETGLGDIKGYEGVYGLQRAFRIAGAKNILMSLWQVSDTATALLLDRFYVNWLRNDMSVREALEEAQGWMRKQDKYSNLYFWAGFVLVGE